MTKREIRDRIETTELPEPKYEILTNEDVLTGRIQVKIRLVNWREFYEAVARNAPGTLFATLENYARGTMYFEARE